MVGSGTAARVLLLAALPAAASAQQSSSLTAERRSYAEWLVSSSVSPQAAVAMHRLSAAATLGPDTADIPLKGFGPATVRERAGVVTLVGPGDRTRTLPRGRAVSVPPWTLQVQGSAGASVLLVFGKPGARAPAWYPQDARLSYLVALDPPARAERRRVLTLDGIEVEAEAAGSVLVPLGPHSTRLSVMRMPVPGTEETELQVYFRDATNDRGTYPAGRFVELSPVGGGKYRVDFNLARNPFCAYSSVYPCPVPWPGNSVPVAVEAGEKYQPAQPGP